MASDAAREIVVSTSVKTELSAVNFLRSSKFAFIVRVFARKKIHVMKPPYVRKTHGGRSGGVDRDRLIEASR